MVCIYCNAPTDVINSRLQRRINNTWRRRKCRSCSGTFTTHETADLSSAIAVRYSARKLQPFNRDRLFLSVYESSKHRPTAIADADGLVRTITTLILQQQAEGVISRDEIIVIAGAVLERFDKTTAAVYNAFHTPATA